MQRKPVESISYIRGYDVTYAEFKTLQLYNFVKSDDNATRLFLHQLTKICHKNRSEVWPQVPFKKN